MRRKLLHEAAGRRTFAVVFDPGEDPADGLLRLAADERIQAASVAGIGGFREATLGYFDRALRDYRRIHVREQVEVMSLLGNLSCLGDAGPKVHVHVVLGRSDATALGGHLITAQVWPTLELMVEVFPAALQRTVDEATQLPLLSP